MADKNDTAKPHRQIDPEYAFCAAYLGAKQELERLTEEEKRITVRKAQLHETMKALAPLFCPELLPEIKSMSLADAIRLVIKNAQRPVSTLEIRSKLKDWGYDLSQHENPLASIHTALKRMEATEELSLVEEDGSEKKKFEPGPQLKAVEFDHSAALAGLAGLPAPIAGIVAPPEDETPPEPTTKK